uniref:Uncharacterized protein n=1 Tax=Globodera rostochiensis TaxID=31243 RepID=A0A914H1A2_GLORO
MSTRPIMRCSRARHSFAVVNPLNVLASGSELENSRKIVLNYRLGRLLHSWEETNAGRWAHYRHKFF